jgi:hypothetical protein
MEDEQTTLDQVPGEPTQHRRGVSLKREYIPANHGVEAPFERHLRGIAFSELHVTETTLPSRQGRCGNRRGGLIGAKHDPSLTNELSREKRDFAGAASDVKYAHALRDASFAQKLPCHRLKEARLGAKAMELVIGVTEDVGRIRVALVVAHRQVLGAGQRMAAKLRPRVMLPLLVSSNTRSATEARGRQLQRLVGQPAWGIHPGTFCLLPRAATTALMQ